LWDTDGDGLKNWLEIQKYHTDPNKPNPNVAYALKRGLPEKYLNLVKPLDSDGVMQSEEESFNKLLINNKNFLTIPTLFGYLESKSADGKITKEELVSSDNFIFLVRELFGVINNEERAKDKPRDIDYAAQLGLRLGFDAERATEATAIAIGEYAVAVKDEGLPEEFKGLELLTKGTQDKTYGADLVDFSPIKIEVNYSYNPKINEWKGHWKYVDKASGLINPNNSMMKDLFKWRKLFKWEKPLTVYYVIKSDDVPRDVWAIAKHLASRPQILEKSSSFLALNIKVQQNMWEISEYGNPTDEKVWREIILPQWDYYWNGAKEGKIFVLAWDDSKKLVNELGSRKDAKIALMKLWRLLPSWKGVGDLDEFKKHGKFVYHKGLDGMKYMVDNLQRVYCEVIKEYPNGFYINPLTGFKYDWTHDYYGWIGDRGEHGLKNATTQFLGYDRKTANILTDYTISPAVDQDGVLRLDKYVISHYPNAINSYLSKYWEPWQLIKFIMGYGIEYGGGDSWDHGHLFYPIAYKAFAIPVSLNTDGHQWTKDCPMGYVVGLDGGFYGLPHDIVEAIKSKGSMILPGNGISPFAVTDVSKDMQKGLTHDHNTQKYFEYFLPLRGYRIIIYKAGNRD